MKDYTIIQISKALLALAAKIEALGGWLSNFASTRAWEDDTDRYFAKRSKKHAVNKACIR